MAFKPPFRVIGRKRQYVIVDARNHIVVPTPFQNRWWAEERAEALQREQRRTQRNCLCCRQSFVSDGPHHRLCNACRKGDLPEGPHLALPTRNSARADQ